MTKIMATLFAALLLVIITAPEARALPRQDAKSVAIDATPHALSNYASQTRDAQRRRFIIQKRAEQTIARKHAELRRAAQARAEAKAARAQALAAQTEAATPATQPSVTNPYGTSSWVEQVRQCIIGRESGGNYRALNPSSGSSGAYQFMDATWQSLTGLPGKAMDYSVAIQDAAFYKLFANGAGRNNWAGGNYPCW